MNFWVAWNAFGDNSCGTIEGKIASRGYPEYAHATHVRDGGYYFGDAYVGAFDLPAFIVIDGPSRYVTSMSSNNQNGSQSSFNIARTACEGLLANSNAVSRPVFSPNGGSFLETVSVTITTGTSGAQIRYTTNGSEPTSGSALYSAPITLDGTTTFKAKGFKDGMDASATAEATFTKLTRRAAVTPVNPQAGLQWYRFTGSFSTLPAFNPANAAETGTVPTFSISQWSTQQNFGILFKGYITAPADAVYTFYTESDDGSKLYIGDQLVVDNDGSHAMQERSGSVALAQGAHDISVLYGQGTGGTGLVVSYQSPSITKRAVPAGALTYQGSAASTAPKTACADAGGAGIVFSTDHGSLVVRNGASANASVALMNVHGQIVLRRDIAVNGSAVCAGLTPAQYVAAVTVGGKTAYRFCAVPQ